MGANRSVIRARLLSSDSTSTCLNFHPCNLTFLEQAQRKATLALHRFCIVSFSCPPVAFASVMKSSAENNETGLAPHHTAGVPGNISLTTQVDPS